jgi:hypothetical protein
MTVRCSSPVGCPEFVACRDAGMCRWEFERPVQFDVRQVYGEAYAAVALPRLIRRCDDAIVALMRPTCSRATLAGMGRL